MTRKLTIYFLLSLMVFQTTGFYLVFEVNRFLVKREVSARISSDSKLPIETIVVSGINPSLKFIGKNEIEYKGRMYDVVYRTRHGDSTVLYCVHDVREDTINTGLARMMKDRTKHLLIPVFGSLAVLSQPCLSMEEVGRNFRFIPFTQNVLSAITSVPESPPEVC
ncbi:MAG: hypothetical protein ACOYM0_08885 [Bacteroidales bacterium]